MDVMADHIRVDNCDRSGHVTVNVNELLAQSHDVHVRKHIDPFLLACIPWNHMNLVHLPIWLESTYTGHNAHLDPFSCYSD